MSRYVVNRLIQAPVILFLLITLSFFLMRFAPGGPFSNERRLDPQIEQALKAKYRLDQPLTNQYVLFFFDLLKGDLGPSFKHKNQTVNEIIARTLPKSIFLGTLALLLALLLGISTGIISSLYHNSMLDYSVMTCAVIGISLPTFVIGPLLQLTFAIQRHWFPLAGYDGIRSPSYIILPAITLALPFAARIARLMRAGMLEIINQDFILAARAKGLKEHVIIFRHMLRGGILPVVSYLGPAFTSVATGSLVVEKIFQVPGLGREFIEGALNRDYTLVMGTVIVYGVLIILFNLLTDIAYGILDPRIRYE